MKEKIYNCILMIIMIAFAMTYCVLVASSQIIAPLGTDTMLVLGGFTIGLCISEIVTTLYSEQ
jgi:small neutral amino acid transporter SnatA (MarC family)